MKRKVIVAALIAVYAMACGDSSTSGPSNNNPVASATVVAGTNSQFSPATVNLLRNGTVTWSFGSLTHNVTFGGTGAPANIGDVANTQVSRTFPNAGTFNYTCTIHPGMNGSVTVN